MRNAPILHSGLAMRVRTSSSATARVSSARPHSGAACCCRRTAEGECCITLINHGGVTMHARLIKFLLTLLIALPITPACADDYSDTIKVFRNAGQSGRFFGSSYGYAVFPTIGKGDVVVG